MGGLCSCSCGSRSEGQADADDDWAAMYFIQEIGDIDDENRDRLQQLAPHAVDALLRWLAAAVREDDTVQVYHSGGQDSVVSGAVEAKRWLKKLLSMHTFAVNLEYFGVWEDLHQALQQEMLALGGQLAEVNRRQQLRLVLGEAALDGSLGRREEYVNAPRSTIRLDKAMPELWDHVAAAIEPHERPELVYITVITLLSAGVDPEFQCAAAACVAASGAEVVAAPIKGFLRMRGKLHSRDDHRNQPVPRPAENIDTVRCLIKGTSAADARDAAVAFADHFGGATYVKWLPDLEGTDASQGRFNVLPLMVTVLIEPGMTCGELAATPQAQAAWRSMRATPPPGVSAELWEARHDAAVAVLSGHAHAVVIKLFGEAQILTNEAARLRHQMHLPYKIYRCVSGLEMHAAFKEHKDEGDAKDLLDAALAGQPKVTARLIKAGADVETTSSPPQATTALYLAAEGDQLEVAAVLLDAGANPSCVVGDACNPLRRAAESGHAAMVMLLLGAGAAVDLGASAPLFQAADNGHVDVVRLLLDAGAAVDAIPDNGATPLFAASQNGHADVCAALIAARADVGHAPAQHGATALIVAASEGHAGVVKVLIAAGADVQHSSLDGTTALQAALEGDAPETAELLQAAGARA